MSSIMQQYYGDKVVMEPILPGDEEWEQEQIFM